MPPQTSTTPTAARAADPIGQISIEQKIEIAAPIETAFEAMLEQLGPENEMPDGTPFPFKLEPWPGGRWFRDLGNNTGHLWAHVQVIKPPRLLELWGPLMMSFPAVNHLQYRLSGEGNVTHLQLTHKAIGLLAPMGPELGDGMRKGFDHWLKRIRERAEAGGKGGQGRTKSSKR